MPNSCSTPFDSKQFPLSTGWGSVSPFDRSQYAHELTELFYSQLISMSTLLEGFNPTVLSPAASDIKYEYPDFKDFKGLTPDKLVVDFTLPKPDPTRPGFLTINPPDPPNIPPWTLGEVSVNIPPIPDPNIPTWSGTAPTVNYPTMPDPLEELRTIDLPVINPIGIPAWEEVDFPYFSATLNEIELVEPSLTVSPGDNLYISRVKDAVEAAIYDKVIHGGTGLDPTVENSIFQRQAERDLQAHNDRLIKLRSDWLKGHFPLPTSMLYAMINEAENDYTNKRLDTSRDISIEQAKLAQTNTHFFIDKALNYEQMMIQWFNNIAQRTFEASKFTMDASIEIFKASIQKYNVLVDVYKAKAQVYEVTANVAIKKLESYKMKLEAAKTTAEINRTNVEVYKTQVEALRIFIDQYRAELEAAKTYLETENLKLTAYKTSVEAYGIQVNAATAYYNMFNTRIEGEKAKVQAYAAGADAYGKRISAVKLGIDAQSAFINAQADVNKSLASVYESDVKAWDAKVKGEIARVEGEVKVYEGQIKGYDVSARVLEAINSLSLKKIDTQLQEYKIEFEASMESAKLTVSQILDQWKMRFQILETMAQVIAQVTSAALNSDALTTHLSESFSYGEQKQVSCTDQHYYDDTII